RSAAQYGCVERVGGEEVRVLAQPKLQLPVHAHAETSVLAHELGTRERMGRHGYRDVLTRGEGYELTLVDRAGQGAIEVVGHVGRDVRAVPRPQAAEAQV